MVRNRPPSGCERITVCFGYMNQEWFCYGVNASLAFIRLHVFTWRKKTCQFLWSDIRHSCCNSLTESNAQHSGYMTSRRRHYTWAGLCREYAD